MKYSKQYPGQVDLEWQMLALQAVQASSASIPCLEDWARSTGFGQTNKRDLHALRLCLQAIEAHHDAMRSVGCQPDVAVDERWPTAVKLVR